ncbi:response regulator [Candidatus Phycosocius bacilliformis]|uniref:response regulator n=1 Tax=Candidatus Phycosocius bacilliformis TaxID=1445552 RepID=UPI001EDEFF06|nr:response regulator [Candidatus Phycosocius bacilliformis]
MSSSDALPLRFKFLELSVARVWRTRVLAASTSIPITILIVDDNQHMRGILKELLRAAGVTDIKEASEPVEAFEYLRSTSIDLLLVDLAMPLIDGVEFTKMVRTSEDSPNPFLPIIMITGHSERSRVNAARDAGVNEFLVKPVTAKSLMERLTLIVNKPRSFVKSKNYFGPDRRRRPDPNYGGAERRKDKMTKI